MADLGSSDVERAQFAFSIYDQIGNGTIDATQLGDVLRALGLNPTQSFVEKLGGTKRKGEKTLKLDEFLPIYSDAKKNKDTGVYEDFIECLKLYDKQENGTMMGAELNHILQALGERLSDKEANEVIKDCLDPEDEDGFVNYVPFVKKFMVKDKW